MVDRYDPELDSETWIRSETGQVVFYSDYEALEAKLARLEENISVLLSQRKEAEHKSLTAMMETAELKNKLARLVEAGNWALNYIRGDLEPHAYSTTEYITSIQELKAAIAATQGRE